MANDPILHLLGLARKAGRLEIGEEPVGAACRARHARLLLLACDAAPNTRRRCAHFGQTGGVLWLDLPYSKEDLGFQLGRGSCAMLAVTDAGLAASLTEKLAARDPEHYGPAARQLRERADQVLQRQREQRQHEKNLRKSRSKPWAAPPPPAQGGPSRSDHRTSSRPKPAARRESAQPKRGGPGRPGTSPGPGGRRLSGKFRHNP